MDYTIKLSQQDIQNVINALGEVPLKFVATTYFSIQHQVAGQDALRAAAASPETPNA